MDPVGAARSSPRAPVASAFSISVDAPAHPPRDHLDWAAETFLCFVPMEVDRREARAILGFSWGYSIREAAISLTPPTRLAPLEWDKHHPLLRREHPDWTFATGYRSH